MNWAVMSANDTRSPRTPASAPATIPLSTARRPHPATSAPPRAPPCPRIRPYCPRAPALGFAGASIAVDHVEPRLRVHAKRAWVSRTLASKPELVMVDHSRRHGGRLSIYGLIIAVIVADGIGCWRLGRHSPFGLQRVQWLRAPWAGLLRAERRGGRHRDRHRRRRGCAGAAQPRVYIGMVLILIFARPSGCTA